MATRWVVPRARSSMLTMHHIPSLSCAAFPQAEFLQGLTKHLLREDAGAHWPTELDFELTGLIGPSEPYFDEA